MNTKAKMVEVIVGVVILGVQAPPLLLGYSYIRSSTISMGNTLYYYVIIVEERNSYNK